MSTLHIIASTSPDAHARCLRTLVDGDCVIYIGHGVLGAAPADPGCDVEVYALSIDAGRLGARHVDGVELIDDTEFVELVARCDRSVSW